MNDPSAYSAPMHFHELAGQLSALDKLFRVLICAT